MKSEKFHAKHPSIPIEWELIGEGGNARVWSDGADAVKRLKDGASKEAVARFKREAEIMLALRDQQSLKIVPVKEVREREGALEIVMDRMDGNLDKAIDAFAGNPERAAAALEPIASTLAAMSDRQQAIYHRDLKPTNLLFKGSPDDLYLADFGCAFLAEDERITPARRAMGAWAYRPPEYSVGRLAEVTDKGDVFGLGKVLWAMINGERDVVFPGPVWFGPEYDLGRLYPGHPRIQHAMLAISSAAAIDPAHRPTMTQFTQTLRVLAAKEPSSSEIGEIIKLLRAQSVIEVEYEQRRAATASFVRALYRDLHDAIAELAASAPEFLMWSDWQQEARKTPQTAEALVEQVAVRESDAPVVNSRFRRIAFTTRFWPSAGDKPLQFAVHIGHEFVGEQRCSFTVSNRSDGLKCEQILDGESITSLYAPALLREFLIKATRQVLQA